MVVSLTEVVFSPALYLYFVVLPVWLFVVCFLVVAFLVEDFELFVVFDDFCVVVLVFSARFFNIPVSTSEETVYKSSPDEIYSPKVSFSKVLAAFFKSTQKQISLPALKY